MKKDIQKIRGWVKKHQRHGHHSIFISDILFEIDSHIDKDCGAVQQNTKEAEKTANNKPMVQLLLDCKGLIFANSNSTHANRVIGRINITVAQLNQ